MQQNRALYYIQQLWVLMPMEIKMIRPLHNNFNGQRIIEKNMLKALRYNRTLLLTNQLMDVQKKHNDNIPQSGRNCRVAIPGIWKNRKTWLLL